jgi:hypothetical protein
MAAALPNQGRASTKSSRAATDEAVWKGTTDAHPQGRLPYFAESATNNAQRLLEKNALIMLDTRVSDPRIALASLRGMQDRVAERRPSLWIRTLNQNIRLVAAFWGAALVLVGTTHEK